MLIEFDARTFHLGPVIFNCDFVINDKVTNFRSRTLAGVQIDGEWKTLSITWTINDTHS